MRTIDAAVEAGVKRFVPAQWGTSSANEKCLELGPLMREKREVVGILKGKGGGGLTCTSFRDRENLRLRVTADIGRLPRIQSRGVAGIQSGVLRIDVSARRAKIWGAGRAKRSATNLPTVGLAVKNAWLMPEHAANRYMFTMSHT